MSAERIKTDKMDKTKISVRALDLYYGENHALKDVNMNIKERK